MKRLLKWWNAEPVSRAQPPIVIDDVPTAPAPMEAETRAAEIDYIQELLKLGRRSASLRSALGESALAHVHRRPHQ